MLARMSLMEGQKLNAVSLGHTQVVSWQHWSLLTGMKGDSSGFFRFLKLWLMAPGALEEGN